MDALPITNSLLERLNAEEPLVVAELRPPRADLSPSASMEAWLGMSASVGRLLRRVPILLTDAAVGSNEEENLQHIINSLDSDISRELICPFLTTKHP